MSKDAHALRRAHPVAAPRRAGAVSVLLDGVRVAGKLRPCARAPRASRSGCPCPRWRARARRACVAGEVARTCGSWRRDVAHGWNDRFARRRAAAARGARVPGEDPVSGDVVDNGDGTYESLSYRVDKAGPLEVALVLARKRNGPPCASFPCSASLGGDGALGVPRGRRQADAALACGRARRRARHASRPFGGPTRDAGSRNRLAAVGDGPGRVRLRAVELGDGRASCGCARARGVVRGVHRVRWRCPTPRASSPWRLARFIADVTASAPSVSERVRGASRAARLRRRGRRRGGGAGQHQTRTSRSRRR